MTVPAFVTSLADHADREALVDDTGQRVSYAELAARVAALAEQLGPRRRLVMVEVASTVEAVTAYLAALHGDHAVIVGKPGDVAGEGEIFERFRPSAVYVAGRGRFEILNEDDPALDPELCALFSTSGSTGSAKLVRLSARNLDANAASIADYLEIDEHEVAPAVLPLSYSYGHSILSSHLLRGARIVLTEHSVVDPEFAALMRREGCTSLSGVPYTWELVEQVGLLSGDWPDLKTLTQAGGKMPASRVARLAAWAREQGARLVVMYGATECTARMAYLPWEHTFDHSDCIGVAIPGGAFHLVDEDGATIEDEGVPGELVYRGPNVMMGYASEREELAQPAGPEERATGDLAERNAAGLYRIVGRLSRFSKILGLRISLDEVERMAQAEGAEDVAAAGDDDLIAVALREGSADVDRVEGAIATRCGIPRDAVVAVALLDELPRLHNGKVDYVAIRERASEIAATRQRASVGLRDEIASLLGLSTLADGESFASLGGDSLTYIQASLMIERRLGRLPDDWERLPIATLEAYERGEGAAGVAGASKRVAIDLDVALRAIAITAVVWNHTRPTGFAPIPGAMATLLMAVGLNLARFRSDSLFRGEGFALVKSTFVRYMLPYWALLVLYLVWKQKLDIPSLLFVSGFFDNRAATFLEPFWFIEVFFQVMLILGAVFSIPWLRDRIAERPYEWGMGAFAALGALHVASNASGVPLPPILLWSGIVALGWCAHFARSTTERMLLSATVLGMPWLAPRGLAVAVVLLLMLWIPRVPVFFEWLKTALGRVGGASFQIYVGHAVILTAIGAATDLRGGPLFPLICIPLSLALGIAWSALPQLRARLTGARVTTPEPEAI